MEISDQILPPEILTLFQEAEFENTGGIFIEKLEYLENSVILRLRIEEGDELPSQLWQVIVADAVSERLSRSWISNVEIYSDHYLLWEFTNEHTTLYTKGNTVNSPEQAGAVFYAKHRKLYGKWLSVETYINSIGLFDAIQMAYGLFAQGPKRILSQYRKWLNEFGVSTYFLELKGPIADDAVGSNPDLKLLILGDSYFIGRQFLFDKITV